MTAVSEESEMAYAKALCEKITQLCDDLQSRHVDVNAIMCRIKKAISPDMSSQHLEKIAEEIIAGMAIYHPDYDRLAAQLWMSHLHAITPARFSDAMAWLYHKNILNVQYYHCVCRHRSTLDDAICQQRDFTQYDYFAVKTLERSYLLTYTNHEGKKYRLKGHNT